MNGYPGADWVSNVRVADQATLTQGRRSERVRMAVLRMVRPSGAAEFPAQCRASIMKGRVS